MTTNCHFGRVTVFVLCICEASVPNGMREMNHQYSFRFVEPGKNVHHGVIWFEHPNYHSMPMRNDTQETSIVRKTEVVSVLRKHIGITNRFQNSGFSLDVKPQTNTYFPSNRSTSHLRSNTSQNDTHEKRNGQLWNPTYGHGWSSYLRFVHTTMIRKDINKNTAGMKANGETRKVIHIRLHNSVDMDLLVGKSKQKKMCRQCHRTKPLNQFLNKNNTSICIICKTCRENQMKRYYCKGGYRV